MSEDTGYNLVLQFDTDSKEFTRGVEIGLLWAELFISKPQTFEATLHLSNCEMLMRVAETLGYTVSIKELDDTWLEATFIWKEHYCGMCQGVLDD